VARSSANSVIADPCPTWCHIRIVAANLAGCVDDTRSQLAVDAAVHHVTAAHPCQKEQNVFYIRQYYQKCFLDA
jgi:hypothetical protein